jgi:D-sedoheptulose 7-phosphate isomerase
MQIDLYNQAYSTYFSNAAFLEQQKQAIDLLKNKKRIFFIGNGGSNSICSHMMEDFAKIARYQTFTFSDAALITCFANDYGYDKAIAEWLKIYFEKDDVLVAISSSGNSMNIINAVDQAKSLGGKVISLSGFKPDNKLKQKGDINFYLPVENYGIAECFHQIILHSVLDELVLLRK